MAAYLRAAVLLLLPMIGAGRQATAQSTQGLSAGMDLTSDHRLRGLSWSDSKPTLRAWVGVPVGPRTYVDAELVATHGSIRADGAGAALSVGLRQRLGDGPVRVDAGGGCRLFPGQAGSAFCEVGTDVAYDLAWVRVDAGLSYAPRQRAIGGDNLYLRAGIGIDVPRSPFSLHGGVGHSTGTVTDALRAARLRPEGAYWDYRVGADFTRDRLNTGLRYVTTSNGQGTVVAHVGISF
ncbi:hypothetical protein LWE61_01645 [Sphingobium sufflavum]|uniref:TorF family putative porin n=1 Tax=Sphingobium sufflavum TaxID=1129547 RepID=UPI001F22065A|nr:TorF family putative porin [Sphingobium sufflavum]MCE7795254.1 hypothetical protein [Sphingobium sufflavum]